MYALLNTFAPFKCMNKFTITTFFLMAVTANQLTAQIDTIPKVAKRVKKDWSKVNMTSRPNDHFMFQIGYDNWAQKPDSISIRGFNRSINVYFLLDFPLKTDPRWSGAIGLGIGSSNIYFDRTNIDIAGFQNDSISFTRNSNNNYFKKMKLATAYLEAPVELRFSSNPEEPARSFKITIGAKIGTLLSAHTRGKNLLNKDGRLVREYVLKEYSKVFFNNLRYVATARISKGVFGIFATYQLNGLIKQNAGPSQIRPYSIGLTISGL
jgi:Outer membrane protein beta-barrel domain